MFIVENFKNTKKYTKWKLVNQTLLMYFFNYLCISSSFYSAYLYSWIIISMYNFALTLLPDNPVNSFSCNKISS